MNLAIIQARVGSQRLPGKVLADVCGQPLLWYVVHRVQCAHLIDQVVVATPDTSEDLAIHAICASWGVPCIAGAEHDVLNRFAMIAQLWHPQPDLIVRITADCPLIDPDVIDATIEQVKNGAQWASNIHPERTWPDGLDVEVVTLPMLIALDASTTGAEREYVTPDLYRPNAWTLGESLVCPVHLGDLRWTVDTQADLDWARQVYRRLPWRASWQQVLFSGLEQRRVA